MNALYDRLYRLSLTNARLNGMCPNPSNDNFLRLIIGGQDGPSDPPPAGTDEELPPPSRPFTA